MQVLLNLHDKQNAIVFTRAIARKSLNFIENVIDDFLRGAAAQALDGFDETRATILELARVHGFGDFIGAGNKDIAGIQLQRAALVTNIRKYPDKRAALFKQSDTAIGANQGRWNVSGIDVVQGATLLVQQPDKHAHIFRSARVGENHLVDAGDQALQRVDVTDQRPQRGLEIGHYQSGGYSLALSVGHNHHKNIGIEPHEIIVIPANHLRSMMRDSEFETGNLRGLLGQEARLYGPGELEIALHPLLGQALTVQLGILEGQSNVG